MERETSSLSVRLFFGGILVFMGVGFVLENMGGFHMSSLLHNWWPLLIVLFGLAQLVSSPRLFFGPLVVITLGILLQLSVLNFLQFNVWAVFWPLVLVLIGVRVMLGSANERVQSSSQSDFANATAVFGSGVAKNNSDTFRGGQVNVAFGGAKLDLRDAELDSKGALIDLNVVFGGADIIVPRQWNVKTEGLPIFGGWDNKSEGTKESPVLTIRGVIIFGGVDIKVVDDDR
jgi:predicted membrane protein